MVSPVSVEKRSALSPSSFIQTFASICGAMSQQGSASSRRFKSADSLFYVSDEDHFMTTAIQENDRHIIVIFPLRVKENEPL
jgi:hypothetical protein